MSPKRAPVPQQAMRLLLDPKRQRFACDMRANEAFMHADQRTRDFRGHRPIDSYRQTRNPEEMAQVLATLLSRPATILAKRLREEPLARVRVPKRPAWELEVSEGLTSPVPLRPIVKQTYLRRCLGNLVAEALDLTSDPLLPPEAIAYRRGRSNPVQEGIREVSREVREGRRFWAKLDVKNFFPSMSWSGLRRSLERFGYVQDFVDVVMALVQTDIVERRGRRWCRVSNTAGAQAGLRESSILANIYLADLDEGMVRRFGKHVFYRRYSDDILLLANTPKTLEIAVSAVKAWLSAEGLRVKDAKRNYSNGVERRSSRMSRSLVAHVSERRIEFLGAEVDAKGDVFIPREKALGLAQHVAFLLDRLAVGGPVIGPTTYMGANAIDLVDRDDMVGVVDGFRRYWADIGAKNIESVIDCVDKRFISEQVEPVRSTPWVARLARSGGPADEQVGDARWAMKSPLTREQIEDLFYRDPLDNGPNREDFLPSAQDDCLPGPVVDGISFDCVAPRGDGCRGEDEAAVRDRVLVGAFVGQQGADGGSERCPKGRLSSRCQRTGRHSRYLDALRVEELEPPEELELHREGPAAPLVGDVVVPSHDDVLDEEGCSSSSSFIPLAIDISRGSPRKNIDDHQASRPAVGSPASSDRKVDEGCLSRVLRTRYVYLDHIASRPYRRLLVGKLVLGEDGTICSDERYWRDGPRHESFVMDLIHYEVRRAQDDGVSVLLVKLPDADLSKRLLQSGRAFRSLPLFERLEKLLALVARGNLEVLIAGPAVMPAEMRAAMERECRSARHSASDAP